MYLYTCICFVMDAVAALYEESHAAHTKKPFPLTNVSWHTHAHRTTQANADICKSRGTLIKGVCVWLAHIDLRPREQLLTWISHDTHTNESCRTCKCDNASKCGCINESCHTYKRVVTHTHTHTHTHTQSPGNAQAVEDIRISQYTHTDKSCVAFECVVGHTIVMAESCRTQTDRTVRADADAVPKRDRNNKEEEVLYVYICVEIWM